MGDPKDKAARLDAELVNAEISSGIEERLAQVNFGDELANEGVTTVALDEEGNLIEHRPDGTTAPLPRT